MTTATLQATAADTVAEHRAMCDQAGITFDVDDMVNTEALGHWDGFCWEDVEQALRDAAE